MIVRRILKRKLHLNFYNFFSRKKYPHLLRDKIVFKKRSEFTVVKVEALRFKMRPNISLHDFLLQSYISLNYR